MNYTDKIDLLNIQSQLQFYDYVCEYTSIEAIDEESKIMIGISTVIKWATTLKNIVIKYINKAIKPIIAKLKEIKMNYLKKRIENGKSIRIKPEKIYHLDQNISNKIFEDIKSKQNDLNNFFTIFKSECFNWLENDVPENIISKIENIYNKCNINIFKTFNPDFIECTDILSTDTISTIDKSALKSLENEISINEDTISKIFDIYDKLEDILDNVISLFKKVETKWKVQSNGLKIINIEKTRHLFQNSINRVHFEINIYTDILIECGTSIYKAYKNIIKKIDYPDNVNDEYKDNMVLNTFM